MSIENRAETYTITDLHQIKALADPLRQQILGAFVTEPRTTKQVAAILGQPPTRLYHHVDQLERVGLIELVMTKPKRGTTERYFQAIAHKFAIADTVLGAETGAVVSDALAEAFTSAQAAIRQSIGGTTGGTTESATGSAPGEGAPRAIYALGALRIAPEDLPELQRRIAEIASGLGEGSGGKRREFYRYLVAVYPSNEADADLP